MTKLFQNFIISILFTLNCLASDYVLVSSKDMQNISIGQIKALYLKQSSYIGDTKIVALNLPAKNSIRKSFEKHVLHMNFSRMKAYWAKQHYLGKRPPLNLKSQKSVKAFIAKVDGAIGYIEVKNIDEPIKILYKWSD